MLRLVTRQPRPPGFTTLRLFNSKAVFGHCPPHDFTLPDFSPAELDNRVKNAALLRLVESYRRHGHRAAHLDPLDLAERPNVPALDPRRYGFDIDPELLRPDFISDVLPARLHEGGLVDVTGILDWPGSQTGGKRTIEEVSKRLAEVYSSGVGYEFMHLPSKHERRFLERLLEQSYSTPIPAEQQLAQWGLLARSEGFDAWAAKRFPNVKRYGLEGAEGMMVALGVLLNLAKGMEMKDVVLAMPHRGRLNVLTQLLDLDMRLLVRKMRGLPTLPSSLPPAQFTDDVLSHLFLSTTIPSTSLRVHVLPNPSHLEAVNPVALGFARGLQIPFDAAVATLYSSCSDKECTSPPYPTIGHEVLSLQVHGDAAFGGQGVVAESLNLANLPHFTVGGTIRLVVNNQLGYTTDARAGRTSFYATDLAKSIAAPVVHVNGDRIDDVARAVSLAFAYRQHFKKDVVIDLVVYRRRGHNELDNPSYTSPVMYSAIEKIPTVPQIYEKSLVASGILSEEYAAEARKDHFALLDASLVAAEPGNFDVPELELPRGWDAMKWPVAGEWERTIETGVEGEVLKDVGRRSVATPVDITVHPRLLKMHMAKRLQSVEAGQGLDFSTAEAMAFGSLMLEGYHVRLCGQDSGRGTFSQRHAVVSDQTSSRTVVPLQTLTTDPPVSAGLVQPGTIEVVNSPLSEYAVVGFEQGIAWVSPSILPIWEAQFGDFADPAQVILDTYFGGGETKWGLQSALTLLLPHGYDSAGPEHSSARIERFLQLTNEPMRQSEAIVPNIHLVNVTNAAQYFHLLRRQMVREYRKPLVVFSPKGILRLPAASCSIDDLAPGTSFQPVLVDEVANPSTVEKVVFLSGKMYYDVVKERSERKLNDKVLVIRIEEISPFPYPSIRHALQPFHHIKSFLWAQEEPENAGAYTFVAPRLHSVLPWGVELDYAGRKAMAVPAPGVGSYFAEQKKAILDKVFEL